MATAWAGLRAHLGPRGATLAPIGILWCWYGIGLIVTERQSVIAGTTAITRLVPLEAWGAWWIACGLLALVAAALRPGRDTWGWGAATGPPLVWVLAYLAASASGDYAQGWAVVPLYAAPVALLMITAVLTGRRRRRCTCERGPDGR